MIALLVLIRRLEDALLERPGIVREAAQAPKHIGRPLTSQVGILGGRIRVTFSHTGERGL